MKRLVVSFSILALAAFIFSPMTANGEDSKWTRLVEESGKVLAQDTRDA